MNVVWLMSLADGIVYTSPQRETNGMIHILIADDSEPLRRGLRMLLERHTGWRVCAEAENGQQAVTKAARTEPDLVVLDWHMPVKDGLEAASEIHQLLPAVPILLFTIDDLSLLEFRARSVGVSHVVSKEDPRRLVQKIEALLDHAA
jgi:DNA-binding NarL/FixJ family response regulator